MRDRWLIAMVLGSALGAACEPLERPARPAPPPPRTAEQRAATDAREKAVAQFRQYIAEKKYLSAVNTALGERLFTDEERTQQIRRLLDMRVGDIESAPALERFHGYGELARFARRTELPDPIAQRYAAAAFRAGASVEDLRVVASAARLAREFSVELDAQWRASARVWALRIDQSGWPNAEDQTFVNDFPLTRGLATAAFDAAMELGRWKAARMIAERAQLPEQQFRAARAKEVEELVAAAIQTRDDQRLLALGLEAPGFVDATVIRTVASRVIAKLIEENKPMEAYGLAIVHELETDQAKRAADIVFDRALKGGAFAIGRQMPDGSFVIVERVPPPPVPISGNSNPPSGLGYR